jgi:DNA gyrase subunit B
MSKTIVHALFSHSAQRLALLDWLAQRAHFDGDKQESELFSQLHALEQIQTFGHLDFLLQNLPLLGTKIGDSAENLQAFCAHIKETNEQSLPNAQEILMEKKQFDTADWIHTVTKQNEEMLRIIHELQMPRHHSELDQDPPDKSAVISHFSDRAERYDRSSHWCTDIELYHRVMEILEPQPHMKVLDVACGTGLVSKWFHQKVQHVLGVDITPAMYEQARARLDEFRTGSGEDLPVESNSVDIAICRQGTQFMRDEEAIKEMVRTVRPGGVVCVINLCAYDEQDKEEYFEILRLRNPVRRNFYLRSDLAALFTRAGLESVQVHDHISFENVDVWSNNGAISEARREDIRNIYRNASAEFTERHHVKEEDSGFIIDHMLFGIAVGIKPHTSQH